jgi:LuxR family maltose regulon positive regulatory protein
LLSLQFACPLASFHLISSGLSNQEIADRLVIAITTVKWHVRQIFNKLNVNSRTQVLARARELNLLSTHS